MNTNIENMINNANTDWDFISFSFNGKNIQDFGLIVIADNNRYARQLTKTFTNNYSTIKGKIGDLYWDTDFGPQTISFSLGTDGMTAEQLRSFQSFFIPGTSGKLIYSESPYKYVYARLNEAPTLSFIAFDDIITKRGMTFKTTLYKGSTSVSFHISNPLWLSDMAVAANTDLTKMWFVESGLPNENMMSTSDYYHIAENKKINNAAAIADSGLTLTNASRVPYYNGGTGEAFPNLSFSINLTVDTTSKKITTFENDAFFFKKYDTLLGIDYAKYIIKPPLVVRDYNTALDLLKEYEGSNLSDANNRNELKSIIYSNIDHPDIISTMAEILNNEQTYSGILTKFANTFSSSDSFTFYIDTENYDIKVSFIDYLYSVENNVLVLGGANAREETAAEIIGNKMLTLSPTKGYTQDFYIQPSCYLSSSIEVSNFSAEFKYTYV